MADLTGISWCDSTFNPWIGCEKISPGCANCYAETLVTGSGPRQLNRPGTWGKDGTRQRTAVSTWSKPRTWERQAAQWAFEHDGRRRRVFCASLADVFEPRPELIPWRAELFELIRATPSLDWLILTKRPDEARDYIDRLYAETFPDVYPHVWLGTSIENSRYTYRADILRDIPAAVRFISAEPLLGSLYPACEEMRQRVYTEGEPPPPFRTVKKALDLTGIDWVIVGGESGGRDARPMHPAWAREIRDAVLEREGPVCCGEPVTGYECCGRYIGDGECCNEPVQGDYECCGQPIPGTRPALHMKQWGSWMPDPDGRDRDGRWVLPDGRTLSSLAFDATGEDATGAMWMRYAGAAPTSGGKYLDGVDWCEVPDYVPPTARLFA